MHIAVRTLLSLLLPSFLRRANPPLPLPLPLQLPLQLLLLLPLLLSLPPAHGQQDTTRILPGTTIRDARFDRTGFTTWKADSLPSGSAMSLADRLLWENPVALRINGPGLLATVSARGAGPSRTPVIWNGLNLQNPQHGVVDVSLLPLWPGDRLEVRYGGQSAAQSSGAMGGSILVDPGFSGKQGFYGAAGGSMGSFCYREAQARLGFSGPAVHSEIRANGQQADNDFPYTNTARIGKPEVRQQNNRLEKLDIQQFNTLIINEKNVFKTAAWHQRVFREIPPAMTENPVETWQRDRSTRAVATWDYSPGARSLWQTRAGFVDETIVFRYNADVDSSRACSAVFGSEISSIAGKRLRWKAGGSVLRQWARADGYTDDNRWFGQTRLAAYAMSEWAWNGGRLSALLRQEWAQDQATPFTWSLGGEVGAGKLGAFRFHTSRNFNLPTFNDRFWKSFGKPELKPEKGYSADVGWVFRKRSFSTELTVFQLLLDNWILWQPDVDGIFKPGNLRQVWSRGIETSIHWNWAKGAWKGTVSGRYQFVKTTNTAVYDGLEEVLNKQLLYTPSHSAGCVMRVERGAFSGAFLHQWTGKRFTTTDNSASLPGFYTGNLLLRYTFFLQPVAREKERAAADSSVSLDFRLENVWNKAYQVIAYRPMPGRNWRLGCTFVW